MKRVSFLVCVAVLTAARAFAAELPEKVPEIRRDHPRLFFNSDTWPAVKAAAEGPARTYRDALIRRCDGYPDDPVCSGMDPIPPGHSSATPIRDIKEWGFQASECALAWRFTGERKYLEKARRMLEVSIAAYHTAYENCRAVNWYSRTRILALCAYDWIYEGLTDAERKAIIVPLMRHVVDVQDGRGPGGKPIVRHNGSPSGYTTGHYGTDALMWYSGVATLGDGYCDDMARSNLETGYGYIRKLFAFRQAGSGDDGPLSTGTCGYAMGEYPWAHFNYFHTLLSAAGVDAAPLYPGLGLFPNFIWWNWIRTDDLQLLFGYGDTRHCQNHLGLDRLNEHLTQYAYFFAASDPDAARLATTMLKHVPPNRLDANWPVYPYLFASAKLPEPFTEEELARRTPKARNFETMGQVIMRSAWKPDATYCMFTAGGTLTGGHRHFDENNFIIYKKGFLALDSGSRAYQDDHNLTYYYAQTVAHNCVLIHKPGEPMPLHWGLKYDGPEGRFCDGGQTRRGGAKMLAFETNPLFTYIASDAAGAYPGKCGEAVRQFLYVTEDCFVVYDRVTADQEDYAKEWLLHTEEEPVVSGGLASAKANGGTLFCRTLLPEGAAQEKIGGPGREFWSNGKNWEINPRYVRDSEAVCARRPGSGPWFGKWRLSVRPAASAKADRFLHVINVSGDERAVPYESRAVREKGRDGAVVCVPGVTVRGRTGVLEVTALFNREGAVGGEIRYRLLDDGGAELFSGHRTFADSIQPQAGVFGKSK